MVTILPARKKQPSLGEKFANAFSSGFESAGSELTKIYDKREKKEKAKAKELTRQREKRGASLDRGLRRYDKYKSFDETMTRDLEDLMDSFIDEGLTADEAFTKAYQKMIAPQEQSQMPSQEQAHVQGLAPSYGQQRDQSPSLIKRMMHSVPGWDEIQQGYRDPKELLRPPAQMGRKLAGAADFASNVLTDPKRIAEQLMGREPSESRTSPVQGLSPHGRETLVKDSKDDQGILSLYDKTVGEMGKPRNPYEEIASASAFGLPGMAGEAASLLIDKLGLPPWASALGNVGIMLLTQGRINKIRNGPKLEKTLEQVAKQAQATGKSADAILSETGVDLAAVAAGDEAALNALSKKITPAPEVAKKVKETPKTVYDKQSAIREREVFGERLAESPIEYYEDIRSEKARKEGAKRPETKARDEARRAELAPEEKRLYEEFQGEKDKLKDIQRGKKKATSTAEKERIGVLEQRQISKLDKIRTQLQDIQYEMKNGRPRATEEYVNSLIEKQVKAIEDYVANPTEEITAKLKKDLADEEVFLDRAEKIMERGELPGEVRPDTFIKMKKKYQDGYKAAVKKNKELIKQLEGRTHDRPLTKKKADIDKVAELKKQNKIFENRIKNLENRITVQKDNIKAMRALDKPSGAFYKQQLKSTRKDLDQFQRDFFKQKRIKSPTEVKVSKQMSKETAKYEKAKPEIERGKKLIEEPTKENIREAAKEADMPESEFSGALKEMNKGTEKVASKMKDPNVTPTYVQGLINKLIQKTKGNYKKLSLGFIAGSIIEVLIQEFGFKLDNVYVRGIFALGSARWNPGVTVGKEAVNWIYDHAQAAHLRTLKGKPVARNKYLKQMESRNGKTKMNRVRKLADEP